MGWQDRAYNRDDNGGIPPVQFRLPPMSKLTIALVIVNLVLFLLKLSPGAYDAMGNFGALTFLGGHKYEAWRWVTYQYLHGSAGHFFFNMLALYFFLPTLELRWGWQKALGFYTLGGIAAGVGFLIIVLATGWWGASLIGASGSVLAILGAVALLYPDRQLILLVFPVPIRLAVGLIGAFYLLSAVADQDGSNAAHLFGLAFGFFAPWLAGPWLANKRRSLERWQAERVDNAERAEQQEIDRILAKVAEQGMQSLSSSEKRALAKATENQQRRDKQRAKRASY